MQVTKQVFNFYLNNKIMKHENDAKHQPTGSAQKNKMPHQMEPKADKSMNDTTPASSKRHTSKPTNNDPKSGMGHNNKHK